MDDQTIRYYEFDCYRLDIHNRILLRDNEIVPLAPKQFDTLYVLVKNNGRAISKDTLMKILWPDAIVEESNVAQNIFHLRKILGEGQDTKYIETVSKYGYRFGSMVKLILEKDLPNLLNTESIEKVNNKTPNLSPGDIQIPSRPYSKLNNSFYYLAFICIFLTLFFAISFSRLIYPNEREAVVPPDKHSIAILPFKELANENKDKHLQLGMTDALINKLSNLHQLSVRPTSAVLKYDQNDFDPVQAGRDLNVDTVLYGTIQRTDEQIRVAVQLVRTNDGYALWAEKFDTDEKELFSVQDTISERISRALVIHLTLDEQTQLAKCPTNSAKAFEAYSKGIYFLNKRNLDQAVKYFQQAIKEDPRFALAYNGLADAYMLMIPLNLGTPAANSFRQLAKTIFRQAIDLDNSLAEPHSLLGLIIFEESGDWSAAEQEYRKAIDINPNFAQTRYWHAWHLLIGKQLDEAIEEMKKARELDPTALNINIALGEIYYFSNQPALALSQLKTTLELDPDNDRSIFYYGLALAQANRLTEALSDLKKLPDISKRGGYEGGSTSQAGYAYVLAAAGRKSEAQHILKQLEKIKEPSNLLSYEKAVIYSALGNQNKALSLLEKAVQTNNYVYVIRLKFDPRLTLLRNEPGFANILRHAGIG